MWIIIFLLLLGTLLLLGELLIFTGTAIAGILSVVAYGAAAAMSWQLNGWTGLAITLGVIIVISVAMAAIFLRSGVWKKLTLADSIDSVSQAAPQQNVAVGDRGVTTTRLAPSGKILINGQIFEARNNEGYTEPQTQVEVVGFDNFTILVKKAE
ncbi:MAG: NfeD family protein [Rikenellaceae bacterium]|nr:NfeD family protein [Rikenellaceae bacterium]